MRRNSPLHHFIYNLKILVFSIAKTYEPYKSQGELSQLCQVAKFWRLEAIYFNKKKNANGENDLFLSHFRSLWARLSLYINYHRPFLNFLCAICFKFDRLTSRVSKRKSFCGSIRCILNTGDFFSAKLQTSHLF